MLRQALCVAALSVLGQASIAQAQTTKPMASGSASFTATSQAITPAGGTASSGSYTMFASVGAPSTGFSSASTSFTATGSVSTTKPPSHTGGPLVLGASPTSGSKLGGGSLEAIGFNFNAAGTTSIQGTIGGVPVTTLPTGTSTRLVLGIPPGTNGFGNPKGKSSVGISSSNGSDIATNAYTYLPSLSVATDPKIGQQLTVLLDGETAPYLYLLLLGRPPQQIGFGLPGIGGALELPLSPLVQTPATLTPNEQVVFNYSIPTDPTLIGATIGVQAIVLTSFAPPSGDFTNALGIQFEG